MPRRCQAVIKDSRLRDIRHATNFNDIVPNLLANTLLNINSSQLSSFDIFLVKCAKYMLVLY